MSMPEVLDSLPRRVADWALNRSLAPNSASGISLALGLCAAAWFSAGTRPDNIRGAVALFASYLAWRAARWLADPGAGAAARPGPGGAGTLAELSATVSDCAVYAGLAVGGYEAHWRGTWGLAAAVVIAAAVRRTAVACGGHVAGRSGDGNPLGRALSRRCGSGRPPRRSCRLDRGRRLEPSCRREPSFRPAWIRLPRRIRPLQRIRLSRRIGPLWRIRLSRRIGPS